MTAFEYEAKLAEAERRNAKLVELLRDIQQCSLLCDSPYLWGKVDRIVNLGDYKESGEHK